MKQPFADTIMTTHRAVLPARNQSRYLPRGHDWLDLTISINKKTVFLCAFDIRLGYARPDLIIITQTRLHYQTMQFNSKTISLVLTMTIVVLSLFMTSTGVHANRLATRGEGNPKHGLKSLLNQAELFIKDKLKPAFFGAGSDPTTPPENRFLVVHTDATWTEALTILIDNQADDTTSSIWLYGDMPRWNNRHADHLWSFACGRTEGKWPMCGKEGYGPDPFDPVSVRDYEAKVAALHGYKQDHKHMRRRDHVSPQKRGEAQRKQPTSVGFAMDLNLLQGANSKHAHAGILQHDVKVVVLESKSLTRCALRDAAFGNVSPLTASVPGRKTGVARAQFAPDAHSATTDASLLAKKRHMLICNEARDPSIMLHALRRHESNRIGMHQLKERLAQEKVAVLSIAIEDLLSEPAKTLGRIMAFVTPGTSSGVAGGKPIKVSPELMEIFRGLDVNDAILEDCADAMHRARVQMAVQDDTGKDLITDLDAVLEDVVVKRKLKLLHDSSKEGRKERNEEERRLAREARIAKATAKAKAKQSRNKATVTRQHKARSRGK